MSKTSIKKVIWDDLKSEVRNVNEKLFSIIDAINPSNEYSIYILEIPYGDVIGGDVQFIPDQNGGYQRLNDLNLPNEVAQDLGYGAFSSPLGLLLKNNIEFYIDMPDKKQTVPIGIMKPGNFYNSSIVLNKTNNPKPYNPNGILKANAGARTIFSLPYLTCQNSFASLQKEIGAVDIPETIYDHCNFFRSVLKNINSGWSVKLVYFSEKWITSIKSDPSWVVLKQFIIDKSWQGSEHERNQFYFDISYSLLLNNVTHVINPYLTDTLRHLLDVCIGAYPGLSAINNSELIPLKQIQHTLLFSYGLKKYYPTIIGPSYFNYNDTTSCVYYSLQYPTTKIFSPKTQKTPSNHKNLESLRTLFNKFIPKIIEKNGSWHNSMLQEALQNTKFTFIHNHISKSNGLKMTQPMSLPRDVIKNDLDIFKYSKILLNPEEYDVAYDAKLFRGCIQLSHDKHSVF